MEAGGGAKKHLRGASVASLIPISALGFFATKPAGNGSASLYTKKILCFYINLHLAFAILFLCHDYHCLCVVVVGRKVKASVDFCRRKAVL